MKKHEYVLYYENGNERILFAENIYQIFSFIEHERECGHREICDIWRIEKRS